MEFIKALNTFTLYRKVNESYHSGYRYSYHLPFEEVTYPMELTMWFQDRWYHSITISILYYVLIKVIQYWMRDRQAFALDRPLFYWNCCHAVYSMIAFIRIGEDLMHSFSSSFYDAVCRTCHPNDVAAFWAITFAASKVAEFGDTLFIVLRKRPLIFLHYYHHAAVLVYTIHSGSEHSAAGRAFMLMNLFAHSLMYTYYAVKANKINVPRWVAMVVTIVQTTQMLLGVALSIFVYVVKTRYGWKCQQSLANVYLAFVLYATFAFLFLQFFNKTYLKTRPRKETSKKID